MRKASFKKSKFEQSIQNEINAIFRFELNDKRLTFVSITKVELSADFSLANVYWDSFDDSSRGDCKSAIDSVNKKVRSLLAAKLNVRHTPQLEFLYDSSFEDESYITNILEDEKREGRFSPDSDDSDSDPESNS